MAPEGLPDPVRVALAVAHIFERLGVPYVTVGALASSLHGEPRSTDDIDFVADLRPANIPGLAAALRGEWYVSEEAVRAAIARGESFNVVHLATAVKVDVFVVGADPFDRMELSTWAERLGVADLLARALAEAGAWGK
jgi:hypothetical protein